MRAYLFFLLVCALVLQIGCEEPFPAYEEPQNVLSASLKRTTADTLTMVQDSSGMLIGADPVGISVFVRNEYVQLLQGDALIDGKLNFTMISPAPRAFSTESLTQSNVVRPPVFQNTIAITPGDSAELRVRWFPASKDFFLNGVPYSEVVRSDSTIFRTYAPVKFHVEGDIRLFERVQSIAIKPMEFTQTYIIIILH
jgi:hypothetical protein